MKYILGPLVRTIFALIVTIIFIIGYTLHYLGYFLWHFKVNKKIKPLKRYITGSNDTPYDIIGDEKYSSRTYVHIWEDGGTVPGYLSVCDYILDRKSYFSKNSQDQN